MPATSAGMTRVTYYTFRTHNAALSNSHSAPQFSSLSSPLGSDWLIDMAKWAVPQYSRNQVDKAGIALIAPLKSEEEEIWCLQVLNNWRSSHSYPLQNILVNLRRKIKTIQKDILTARRIKRRESIEAKLLREQTKTMQLSQMQDIAGCRAVMSSHENSMKLVKAYHRGKFAHELKNEKDYIVSPKPDGYRSYHLIYQYKALENQNLNWNKLRIEIQIRSKLQHAWATAVEAVGIFTRQALKSNQGDEDWRRLFALMSSEIAVIEGTPIVPGTPTDRDKRLTELSELAHKIRALNTLDTYSAILVWVGKQDRNAKYYLLQYDYNTRKVLVEAYGGKNAAAAAQRANLDYTRAEQNNSDGSKNIVLVSVASIGDLRRAYPNYFLDTKEFSELLTKIVNEVKARPRVHKIREYPPGQQEGEA
jgi:hypothetical protein